MGKTIFILFVAVFMLHDFSAAQLTKEKITEYLHTSKFPIDSEASAIVLYESIDVHITKGSPTITQVQSLHRIIKILKKGGLKEADIKIYLPNGANTVIDNIAGITYNLNANNVTEIAINKTDNYLDDKTKQNTLKFLLPAVKEGSIIDYSYDVTSPLPILLPVWNIQEQYPKLFSQYSISCPSKIILSPATFSCPEVKDYQSKDGAIDADVPFAHYGSDEKYNTSVYVRKNVSAFRPEPYVLNLRSYMERMEFQVAGNENPINTWKKYNQAEWKKNWIQEAVTTHRFLKPVVEEITKKCKGDSLLMAKSIFNYVRTNFRLSNPHKTFVLEEIYNQKSGAGWEINVLLSAMLNTAGLEAYIFVGGNRDQYPLSSAYPLLSRINYIGCVVGIDSSSIYFLDASNKNSRFGMIPLNCYNGFSWILTEQGEVANLTPDLAVNNNVYTISVKIIDATNRQVSIKAAYGDLSSFEIRQYFDGESASENKFFENMITKYAENATITNSKIDNLNNPDTNVIICLDFIVKTEPSNGSFFASALYSKISGKQFVPSSERNLPIEFPNRQSEIYNVSIVLPKNAEPVQLLTPETLSIDQNGIVYNRLMSYSAETNTININTKYTLNKTSFTKEFYNKLTSFYESVSKDQNKVIEFKQKKS